MILPRAAACSKFCAKIMNNSAGSPDGSRRREETLRPGGAGAGLAGARDGPVAGGAVSGWFGDWPSGSCTGCFLFRARRRGPEDVRSHRTAGGGKIDEFVVGDGHGKTER